MKTSNTYTPLLIFLGLVVFSCTTDWNQNKLLKSWTGPYMGTPAFDKMQVADVKPAMLKAMELNLSEIEAIATNPEPPTFENNGASSVCTSLNSGEDILLLKIP